MTPSCVSMYRQLINSGNGVSVSISVVNGYYISDIDEG